MDPFQAVIFDFDLTLADSTRAVTSCITFALEELGFEPASPADIRKTIGLSLEATMEALTGLTDPSVQASFRSLFVKQADRVMVAQTEILPGAASALSLLRGQGLRAAIVSTKYRYRIEAILDRHGMRKHFDVIVGGEDTTNHKPHPEGLERAVERLGVSPGRVLYVGDHLVDAIAAKEAGVPFVPVLSGATDPDTFLPFPHLGILSSVAELPGFLADHPGGPPAGGELHSVPKN